MQLLSNLYSDILDGAWISRGREISVKANWHLSAVSVRLSVRWLTAALVCGPVKLGDGQVCEHRVVPTPLHVFIRGLLLLVTGAVLQLLHTGPAHTRMTRTLTKQCTAHCGWPSFDCFASAGSCLYWRRSTQSMGRTKLKSILMFVFLVTYLTLS